MLIFKLIILNQIIFATLRQSSSLCSLRSRKGSNSGRRKSLLSFMSKKLKRNSLNDTSELRESTSATQLVPGYGPEQKIENIYPEDEIKVELPAEKNTLKKKKSSLKNSLKLFCGKNEKQKSPEIEIVYSPVEEKNVRSDENKRTEVGVHSDETKRNEENKEEEKPNDSNAEIVCELRKVSLCGESGTKKDSTSEISPRENEQGATKSGSRPPPNIKSILDQIPPPPYGPEEKNSSEINPTETSCTTSGDTSTTSSSSSTSTTSGSYVLSGFSSSILSNKPSLPRTNNLNSSSAYRSWVALREKSDLKQNVAENKS